MKEWGKSADGRWSLSLDGRSLSLPTGFDLDHSNQDVISFTGITSAHEMSWVAYEREPAQRIIDTKLKGGEFKVLGVQDVGGLDVTEIAPTTPSGRAKPKVRIHVVALTNVASLTVFGGGDGFAISLAQQWAANRPLA